MFVALARSRAMVACCLLGYLAATIGFPLPASVVYKPGQPFPCQQHACGCASAEQCWKSCCCFTPQQKLSWALDNHVEPPAELVAEVGALQAHHHDEHDSVHGRTAEHGHSAQHEQTCHAHDRCQQADSAASSCASHTARDDSFGVRCCSKPSTGCHPATAAGINLPTEKPAARAANANIVIGKLWRGCRGLSSEWLAGGIAPPPAQVDWTFQWDVRERFAYPRMLFQAGELAPPVPPPPQV